MFGVITESKVALVVESSIISNVSQTPLSANLTFGRWQFGEMVIWGDGNLGRWQFGEMEVWGDGNLGRSVTEIWGDSNLGDGNLGRWQFGEMIIWGDGNLGRWRFGEMGIYLQNTINYYCPSYYKVPLTLNFITSTTIL